MSAPHVTLQGFSTPAVNAGVVEVLCTLGLKPAVLSGTEGLMCSLARDILAACGQQTPATAATPPPAVKHREDSASTRRKCELVAAELEKDRSHGRQARLCRQHRLNPSIFIRWRNQQAHAGLRTADNPR